MSKLLAAARRGLTNEVNRLLDSGADINEIDAVVHITALHGAAASGQLEVVRLLVARGANIELGTESGYTPLMVAVRIPQVHIIPALIELGADINAQTSNEGRSPLHIATEDTKIIDPLTILLKSGADVNILDKVGDTPIVGAAWNGRIEHCRLLLEYGATVGVCDSLGRTPLSVALAKGHDEVAELLRNAGARE